MTLSIENIAHDLFEKREGNLSGIYGLAGFVLLILGLVGFPYGAAIIFWPLALISFSLIVYPTLFAWGLISGGYSIAAITYIIFTIYELLTEGVKSTIYSDGLLIYFIYIFIIIAIAALLLFAMPSKNTKEAITTKSCVTAATQPPHT